MPQCYHIPAIKQRHPDYQTRQRLGVVILNKTDYIKKMNSILEDETKFLTLGPSCEKDNTSKIESWIQRRLLELHKKTICSLQIYTISFDRLVLSGRACTAFPKHTRKMCHSDPILSMTGSALHQLAK